MLPQESCSHRRKGLKDEPNSRSHRRRIEAVGQVNLRPADCGCPNALRRNRTCASSSLAISMAYCWIAGCLERHLRSASDCARTPPRVRIRKAPTGSGPQIKLCFQIFQIQCKIQDIRVGQNIRRSLRSRVHPTAATTCARLLSPPLNRRSKPIPAKNFRRDTPFLSTSWSDSTMLPPRFETSDSVESNLQTKYERRCEFGLPSDVKRSISGQRDRGILQKQLPAAHRDSVFCRRRLPGRLLASNLTDANK